MHYIDCTGIVWPSSQSSVGTGVQGTDANADGLPTAIDVNTSLSFVSDLRVSCFLLRSLKLAS